MSAKDEAARPFRIIRQRLQKDVADKLNVDLTSCAFMIGDEDGDPDVVQVVFALTKDSLKDAKELEQKRINDEFERMMAGETFIDKAADLDADELDLWEEDV